MANISYGFNRTRPRTTVFLNANGLGSQNLNSEKPLVLLGSANGGQPQAPISISSYAQAKQIFRAGELLDAIEMAWNPSPNVGGAGKIIAVRTDSATQATFTNGGLNFTSNIYGSDANGIQVELDDNPLTGAKTVTVNFTQDAYSKVYDNLGNIFTVQYTGTTYQAAQVQVVVDATTHMATQLILSAGTTGSLAPIRTYNLGSGVYQDVNVLVNDISNLPDWLATMNTLGGNKNIKSQYLDAKTATDCKTSAVTVKAIGADMQVQMANDPYVSVAIDRSKIIPATLALTSLSGGSQSAPPASWSTILNGLANEGGYYLVPLTGDQSIHGEVAQFLADQANAGNAMRGLVGAGINEGINQLQGRQASLRDSRVGLIGNSGTRRMNDGRVYNFPGYMFAALVGGIASGLPVGEPITYKHVNIDSIDQVFTSDQLDQLDSAGVIMAEFVRTRQGQYFRLVSDPTTYNDVAEPVQNRMSLGEVSDYLTSEIRTLLDEQFIGTRLGNTSASILKNAVESFLDQQKNVGGLIVDYNPSDVQVIIQGNTATINFTCQPAQGLDYINCYITYLQDSLSASGSNGGVSVGSGNVSASSVGPVTGYTANSFADSRYDVALDGGTFNTASYDTVIDGDKE
jgi:archaellum component FlaG (FlaF/FlaG flagellin family)